MAIVQRFGLSPSFGAGLVGSFANANHIRASNDHVALFVVFHVSIMLLTRCSGNRRKVLDQPRKTPYACETKCETEKEDRAAIDEPPERLSILRKSHRAQTEQGPTIKKKKSSNRPNTLSLNKQGQSSQKELNRQDEAARLAAVDLSGTDREAGQGESEGSLKLNLGSSDRAFPGFVAVDMAMPADMLADLSKPWPWKDSSVDEVRAHDIFEHLPSRIQTMNELHRVLKPGGRATVEVPSAAHGAGFAQDPTHVSPWCMNSFQYFQDGSIATKRFSAAYGITARFKIVHLGEYEYMDAFEPVWKVTTILEAVKQ